MQIRFSPFLEGYLSFLAKLPKLASQLIVVMALGGVP